MPSRKAWITPDTIPAATRCRVLLIPDDPILYANVSGALLPLIFPDNWEQVGLATPQQCADAMNLMYTDFLVSECVNGMVEQAQYGHLQDQNVGGGSVTAGADIKIPWTAEVMGATWIVFDNANDRFELQPGNYTILFNHAVGVTTGAGFIQLRHSASPAMTSPTTIKGEQINYAGGRVHNWAWPFAIAEVRYLEFYVRTTVTLANNGLGLPSNISGQQEVYGGLNFLRLGDAP